MRDLGRFLNIRKRNKIGPSEDSELVKRREKKRIKILLKTII